MISLKVIGIAVCIYILLCSAVLLIMTSSISYQYFSNDILIFSPSFNLSIFFGCGIGASILIFIGLCIFLFFPQTKYNFIITFPLFLLIPCSYIYLTKPGSTDKFLSNWSEMWTNSLFLSESFQEKQKCCGWLNFSDRSIDPCPMSYQSGCSHVVLNYLFPRFREIFFSSIFVLLCGTISSAMALLIFFLVPDHNILVQLDVF